MPKVLKETAGIYRKWIPSLLVNQDNRIVLENEEKINIWEKYIGELFYDNKPLRETKSGCLTGPSTTKEEIEKTIGNLSRDTQASGWKMTH